MTWASLSHVLSSAAATAWLTIAGGLIAFLLQQRAARKVKVGGVTWERIVAERNEAGLEVGLPEIRFTVFNGLHVDVGLHQLTLDLRHGRTKHNRLVAPQVGELPKTVKAQHSAVLKLDARAVSTIHKILDRGDAGPWSYRLRLVLGNGSEVVTLWRRLPDPETLSAGTNSDGDP